MRVSLAAKNRHSPLCPVARARAGSCIGPEDQSVDDVVRSADLVGDGWAKSGDRADGHDARPASTLKRWLYWADRLKVLRKDRSWWSSKSWRVLGVVEGIRIRTGHIAPRRLESVTRATVVEAPKQRPPQDAGPSPAPTSRGASCSGASSHSRAWANHSYVVWAISVSCMRMAHGPDALTLTPIS